VPDTVVARTLVQQDPLTAICQSLINAANVAGGPDNITTIIVNYRGTKQVEMDTLRSYGKVRAADPPKGIAAALHDRLLALQSDIHWLIKGTSEISSTPEPERLSTVKRILDEDTYAATATEHTNTNSLHLFHAAATDKQSQWRLKYETHHFELSKHLTTITASGVRFSPIMTSDETAHILTTLWRDWRRVEKRYFQLCQESNFDQKQDMLNFLLDHMRNSVNTLIGLMRFLPMFMRNVD
jgi:PPM family protein phosphatase